MLFGGILNGVDTSDNGNGGDGSTINYSDGNSDGIPAVYGADLDGVANHLDLDSHNDGIYDVDEAGHGQLHTSDEINCVYGANGLANDVETATESGILNYSISNTLSITNPYPSDNGNQYRAIVSNSLYICSAVTSTSAILSIHVTT